MATRKNTGKPRKRKAFPGKTDTFAFGKKNYLTLLIGLAVIIVGYITLRMGSITLAPALLVLGYCVIIPIGILLRPKKIKEQQQRAGNH
jgi:uncharacterized membrane protein HdeD (DUF308 family)